MVVGTRAQVMHGTANETSGGLKKSNLKMKDGRIVSKKASKGLNPFAKAWSDATKKVMAKKKSKTFRALKKGSVLYKQVRKEYEKLLKSRGVNIFLP